MKGESNIRMLLVVHVEGKRDDHTFSLGDEGVVFIGWLHEYEFHDFFFNSSTSSRVPSAEILDWGAKGNEK